MDGTLMRELTSLQAEMVIMEGMIEALIKGTYNGTRIEYIGSSLEILREYMGQRSDKLDRLIRV